uniref:Structural polyprotein n=1 Tax=Davidia involucrata TaxID=16924 RepID=A0A5B6ZBJ0_DAVIN
MTSSNWPLLLLFLLFLVSASFHLSLGHETSRERDSRREGGVVVGRRVLMSFKETPSGGNVTFECSPSGPCIACLYSEKSDENYRCSETGYRIPLKCVEIGPGSKEADNQKTKSRSTLENTYDKAKPDVMLHDAEELTTSIRQRHLLDDSSTFEGGSQTYITYRSCVLAVNEEKLSVLGFEGILLCLLLVSGSVVYFRRKQTGAISGFGAVRTPTNFRF